jgi:hypothetical protein
MREECGCVYAVLLVNGHDTHLYALQLLNDRAECCRVYLPQHAGIDGVIPLLKAQGSGSMSDLESDTENGVTIWKVHRPSWRSPAFNHFLDMVDSVSQSKKSGRGAKATTRVKQPEARDIPVSKVPRGLPQNCYSKQYLSRLSDEDRRAIAPIPTTYNFA